MRKKTASLSIDVQNYERLANDSLTAQFGKSGVVRMALNEYYEKREKSEKADKNKTKGEVVR